MTPEVGAAPPTTAVLLVHGIGEQAAGSTLDKFLTGLNNTLVTPVEVERGPDRLSAEIHLVEQTIVVREVWWADVLSGDAVAGTFRARDLNSIGWFPWLNRRFGVAAGPGGALRTLAWTIVLGPLTCLLQVVGWVAVTLRRFKDGPKLFDAVIADVTNYTASAANAAPAESPAAGAAAAVQQRFIDAANSAVADGAVRLVVVAHSLGTVIAYHAILGVLGNRPANSVPVLDGAVARRIDTLITIGSPLEKIRWIWPMLVDSAASLHDRAPALRWTNLRDRLDLVSGKLRHRDTWGPVADVALFGRAWLVNAHTAYERNPEFVRILAAAVGYPAAPVHQLSWRRRARLVLGSVALSLGTVVAIAVAVGIALVLAVVAALVVTVIVVVSSYFKGASLGAKSASGTAQLALYATPVVIAVMVFVAPIVYGRVVASYQHYAFRYGQWPARPTDASADRPPVVAAAAAAALTTDTTPTSTQTKTKTRWRGRLGCATLVLGYLALSYPVGLLAAPIAADFAYAEQSNPSGPEWAPSGYSPGVVILEIVEGMLALVLISAAVAAVGWLLIRGLPGAVRAYRQWVLNTTRPPGTIATERAEPE